MKIALFGGTFDPVHLGHLIIAEWALSELSLDKVVFIPNYSHPFNKRGDISTAYHRIAMLRLALKNYPQFEISEFEIEQKGVSYTVDTINHFYDKNSATELYCIMGADNISAFDKWKEPQKIMEMAKIIVFNRKEARLGNHHNHEQLLFLDSPLIELSSSMIRRRMAQDLSCQSMLPPDVSTYIESNKLYR